MGRDARLFLELPVGRWVFRLRSQGFSSATAVLDIVAEQTNVFRTNLVSINFGPALATARQYLAAADYEKAYSAAGEALQVKPNDADAMAVQKKARGMGHLRKAEWLGKKAITLVRTRNWTLLWNPYQTMTRRNSC